MGRLIEESRVVEILQQTWLSGTIAHRFIDDIKRRIRIEVPTIEAIPKADYENRLKADLVAMLTEIQLDIEKHTMTSGVTNQGTWNECIACCNRVIQEKINSLKEDTGDK